MSRFNSKPEYTHGDTDSVGILLVNLGTPEKPTANSVRTYLREFLSDYRVIEIPKFLWLLILYLFILPLTIQISKSLSRDMDKKWFASSFSFAKNY